MRAAAPPRATSSPCLPEPGDRVCYVAIDSELAEQRIDNFLLSRLKGVPRSRVYRLLRTGEVRVNKGRVKPDYRLAAGDEVRIPPVRRGSDEAAGAVIGPRPLHQLEGAILYQDDDLLLIDKPAGMAVHGGSGVSFGVIEALRQLYPMQALELVHRLDRDTSGCLLVSKCRSGLRRLHELMRAGTVEKRYLALLKGPIDWDRQRVNAALRKNLLRSGEREVRVDPEGSPSVTLFRRIQVFTTATLVEARLLTGRTHQIRVHAAHLGHPILGDEKYGDPVANREMRRFGLRRLFLHASTLSFPLSGQGKGFEMTAPLPAELQFVLERLCSG